jgi:hypothetical protein
MYTKLASGMIRLMITAGLVLGFIAWSEGEESGATGSVAQQTGSSLEESSSTPSPFDLERMAYYGEAQ